MSSQDFIFVLPVLIIAGSACLLLVIDLFVGGARRSITPSLAALALIGALVVAISQFGNSGTAFGGMLIHDGFSSFLQMLFLVVGLIAIAQAFDYLHRRGIERGAS